MQSCHEETEVDKLEHLRDAEQGASDERSDITATLALLLIYEYPLHGLGPLLDHVHVLLGRPAAPNLHQGQPSRDDEYELHTHQGDNGDAEVFLVGELVWRQLL